MLEKHQHHHATRTFDGIVDNRAARIPWYFVALFWGLVIWAVAYMGIFLFGGWSSQAEFDQRMGARQAAQAQTQAAPAPVETHEVDLAAATALFGKRCAGCHAKDAHGGVGPDLHRVEFTYGRELDTVVETITKGRPKGMPAFGNKLTHEEIEGLARYVRTLD